MSKAMALNVVVDNNLIAEIASDFNLREPNREALKAAVARLESGDFDPQTPQILNLATGAGKTYVMAALIEYLRHQGHYTVMVITPSTVVQNKTVDDFTRGSKRYLGGFRIPPHVITPGDVHHLRTNMDRMSGGQARASDIYVFNVQQLYPPKEGGKNVATGVEGARRKTWKFQEASGVLGERLAKMDDLVVIIDEAHLFGDSAEIYQSAFKALLPAATFGLTASASKDDDIIFEYPLYQALADGYVKQPVLVYRNGGYGSDSPGEGRQLQDALSLLRRKEEAYEGWRLTHPDGKQTKPLLFVVCQNVNHATEIAERLRQPDYFDSPEAVLQVDSKHTDSATQSMLRYLDSDHSPVRCIVSVNKLREGWDTKRIAVMCTLRAMGSEILTQQVMGRGLRLPFGSLTGEATIDELDILSHQSFVDLLDKEDVLREFGLDGAVEDGVDTTELITGGGDTETAESTVTLPATTDPGNSAHTFNSSDSAPSEISSGTHTPDLPETGSNAHLTRPRGVSARKVGDDEAITPGNDHQPALTNVYVTVNKDFEDVEFTFPTSSLKETIKNFMLDDYPLEGVKPFAAGVKNTMATLERRKIVADAPSHSVKAEAMDRVKVQSYRQTEAQVVTELVQRVAKMNVLHAIESNFRYLKQQVIPFFIENSGIDTWTENAKESAAVQLAAYVRSIYEDFKKSPTLERTIAAKKMPIRRSIPVPKVHDLLDIEGATSSADAGFNKNRYYGPWVKGLFDGAKFDSFNAEYRLACLFNFDPDVVWWTRLYEADGACVAYTVKNDYYPDFVVRDTDGVYWVIEAKADRDRDDETVKLKQDAMEDTLRKLYLVEDFEDQTWQYLLAFESDIKASSSFDDLRP